MNTLQSQAIDAMLDAAQRMHAKAIVKPDLEAKFLGFVLRQLIRNFDFNPSVAELILLNYTPPQMPEGLTDAQIDRSAAMVAANLNRTFTAMVEAGFQRETNALCEFVGRTMSDKR